MESHPTVIISIINFSFLLFITCTFHTHARLIMHWNIITGSRSAWIVIIMMSLCVALCICYVALHLQ